MLTCYLDKLVCLLRLTISATANFLCSLTEITFHEAIHDARVLDSYFAKHKKPIGPLHGIPMSLKDQFNVQGHDTTLGYVGRSFSPASQDATIVKMLRSLKAVIVAKTNIPQSIMVGNWIRYPNSMTITDALSQWSETDNPLWGLTTNPMHPGYTPGGSSGGESSLLAMNGSMIGWGTDIGGSIRAPAHMMGLYGFKPSVSDCHAPARKKQSGLKNSK